MKLDDSFGKAVVIVPILVCMAILYPFHLTGNSNGWGVLVNAEITESTLFVLAEEDNPVSSHKPQQASAQQGGALQKRLESLQEKGAQIVGQELNTSIPKVTDSNHQSETQAEPQPAVSEKTPDDSKIDNTIIPTVKADIKVGARDLWQDFSENVISAEKKYSGKCIAVLGQVTAIRGDDTSAMVYLVGNNSLVGAGVIACIMKHDEINKAAMLMDGDQVEITGTCGDKSYYGFTEGVELSNCVITSELDSSISREPINIIEEPVTVSVLVREHRDNEIAARQKYDGKKFVFTGKVIQIDRDFMGNSYVLMGGVDEMCDIFCYMAANSEDVLATINGGEYIKLLGVCQSSSCGLFDAIRFSDCVMLK